MDTSELSERFFDENEVFYSADKRNKTVFGEAEQTQEEEPKATEETNQTETDGEETAILTEETESIAEAVENSCNEEKNELISVFESFKQDNPNATLNDFYEFVARKINKEEGND